MENKSKFDVDALIRQVRDKAKHTHTEQHTPECDARQAMAQALAISTETVLLATTRGDMALALDVISAVAAAFMWRGTQGDLADCEASLDTMTDVMRTYWEQLAKLEGKQ